jgi:hypothetical protein
MRYETIFAALLALILFISSVLFFPSLLPAWTGKCSVLSTATSNQNLSGVEPVWSANAETSNLNQLGIKNGQHGNGSPDDAVTLTSAPAASSPSGDKAFKLTTNDGRIEFDLYPGDLIQNEFYFSFWVYIPSSVTPDISSGQWLDIFQLEGSIRPDWDPIYGICIGSTQAGNHVILYGIDNDNNPYYSNGVLADSGLNFPRDQWVHLEFYCHVGVNGAFEAWINRALLWSVNDIDNSGLHQSTMYFMPCLYGTDGTLYVDKMALYNVNMNGQTA